MKYLFFPLFIILFIHCNKEASSEQVCFVLSERQCAMDPYQKYSNPNDSTKLPAIKVWLESIHIKEAAIAQNPPFTGAVCQACICPSGLSYNLSISVSDTAKLRAQDIKITPLDCK